MSYTPGENIIGKGKKPIKTQAEYEEGTAFVRNDGRFTGEVVDESTTISDDIFIEVGEELPEAIRRTKAGDIIHKAKPGEMADGGRIGFRFGGKGPGEIVQDEKKMMEKIKKMMDDSTHGKFMTPFPDMDNPLETKRLDSSWLELEEGDIKNAPYDPSTREDNYIVFDDGTVYYKDTGEFYHDDLGEVTSPGLGAKPIPKTVEAATGGRITYSSGGLAAMLGE